MILDIHTHIGEKENVRSTQQSLHEALDAAGVDQAACFPLTGNVIEDNRHIHSVSDTDERIIPFYRLNPHETTTSDVAENARKYDGVKLHPRGDDFDPVGSFFEPYLDVLQDKKLPVLIHTRKENNPYSDPNRLLDLPEVYPDIDFVFAHFANGLKSVFDALNAHPNLYLDTSIVSSPYILEQAVSTAGDTQILFGSDYPLSNISIEKAKITQSDLPKDSKQRILGANAEDLLC